MVGNTPDLTELAWAQKGTTGPVVGGGAELDSSNNVTIKGKYLYIPLQFWFCRNPGLNFARAEKYHAYLKCAQDRANH